MQIKHLLLIGLLAIAPVCICAQTPASTDSITAPAKKMPLTHETHNQQQPSYPGGDIAIFTALSKVIKYPAAAAEKGIEGRAIVGFTIEVDGSMSNIHIERTSGNEDLDAEALRIVPLAITEPWQPGLNDGQPVTVQYNIPITFRLDKPKKK